jgi:arginine decarboxylase
MNPSTPSTPELRIDHLFSVVAARTDRWSALNKTARTWAARFASKEAHTLQAQCAAALEELRELEAFHAYPGQRLLAMLTDRVRGNDAMGTANLVQRIASALMNRSYRRDPGEWDLEEEPTRAGAPMPGSGGDPASRPYFEVLFVTPTPANRWPTHCQQIRKLRRPLDQFVYEPVFVGSLEDAVLGVLLNASVQSVVMYQGFGYASAKDVPLLRNVLARALDVKPEDVLPGDLGTTLARVIKALRPEVDVFLLADSLPDDLATEAAAAGVRRVFYEVEEPLEIHLSILAGVAERYETPFFDNLKRYAQKPVGTFHALPVARGKSIFRSDWIRDMGEFYGPTLFLAESSATTGGLDSLLEPTGNIKKAQDAAARAFGADHVFFVTNGTSTSNKMVYQALCQPGDIVIVDRNCHKSHHYGCVLAGAQPYYVEAYPLTAYSMYGSVPVRSIKKALLDLKAAGRLDKVRMLALTNVTFDGHMYDTARVMEECLAIKPDLIFLWDEAWFGFARWAWMYRARTAMGARARLKRDFASPASLQKFLAQEKQFGKDLDPKDARLLDARLVPDPRKARLRVYQTNSTHKSMSALRQGSMVLVGDQDFHQHLQEFKEAVFTHASTSPNLQIIASLDVARRQMELEGYDLVMHSIALAIEIRRSINTHPLVSKYFRVLTPADMVPAEYRKSGFTDYLTPGTTWADVHRSFREDEFVLDPTRLTLVCGTAGYDGTQFKNLLAAEYEIQLNKTSRNSVLLQTNINNTRSDAANLLSVLVAIANEIEARLADGGASAKETFAARVKSLMEDVPELPNFSRFHDRFRTDPKGTTLEGDMRTAFYMAYRAEGCEYMKLSSQEVDKRIKSGPPLVSANFVIPYPPGFPIMVPGQVIEADTIGFMRKLDVKEIHGYDNTLGLKLITPAALGEKAGGAGHDGKAAKAPRGNATLAEG